MTHGGNPVNPRIQPAHMNPEPKPQPTSKFLLHKRYPTVFERKSL